MSITIGLISDVHSNLVALEAVLARLKGVDKLLFAGDLVGYGPCPNEVIAKAKKWNFEAIAGNHDVAALTEDVSNFNPYAAKAALWTAEKLTFESRSYLAELPRRRRFELEGKKILMVHGSPNDDDEYIFEEDITEGYIEKAGCDILIVGHSHVQWTAPRGKRLAFNPGSAGQPRDHEPDAAYAVLMLPEMKLEQKRVPYDIDATAKKMREFGLPAMLSERLYSGY